MSPSTSTVGCREHARIPRVGHPAFPRVGRYGKLVAPYAREEAALSVDKALDRDRELRDYATPRPWHQDGHGTRSRLLGPLPRASVVVDPYAPNPQDAPLLLHRVNSYEALEEEIVRLRETLREIQAELDALRTRSADARGDELLESLANDLRARIGAALGDRRAVRLLPPPGPLEADREAARIPDART